jgi:phage replication O-like protein O
MMRELNGAEFKVLAAIMRKTFGWNKSSDRISLSQLEDMTGLSRQGVINALHGKKNIGGLINYGVIICEKTEKGCEYLVNLVDQPEPELVNKVDQPSQQSRLALVNKVDTQKKLSKETIKRINSAREKKPEKYESQAQVAVDPWECLTPDTDIRRDRPPPLIETPECGYKGMKELVPAYMALFGIPFPGVI